MSRDRENQEVPIHRRSPEPTVAQAVRSRLTSLLQRPQALSFAPHAIAHVPHHPAAAGHRPQPVRPSAPGAGGAARCGQDHPGAAGAAGRAVAAGPQDRDAGAAPRGGARGGRLHGQATGRSGRRHGRLPHPFREQSRAGHADRGGHRRHPDPDDPGRSDAGEHRRDPVRRIPRAPPGRRSRPGIGAGRAGAAARGPAHRRDVRHAGRREAGAVPRCAAAEQRRPWLPGASGALSRAPGRGDRSTGAPRHRTRRAHAPRRCAGVPAGPARDRAVGGDVEPLSLRERGWGEGQRRSRWDRQQDYARPSSAPGSGPGRALRAPSPEGRRERRLHRAGPARRTAGGKTVRSPAARSPGSPPRGTGDQRGRVVGDAARRARGGRQRPGARAFVRPEQRFLAAGGDEHLPGLRRPARRPCGPRRRGLGLPPVAAIAAARSAAAAGDRIGRTRRPCIGIGRVGQRRPALRRCAAARGDECRARPATPARCADGIERHHALGQAHARARHAPPARSDAAVGGRG